MRYGRKPRAFGPVPHLSALRRALKLAAPTAAAPPLDYATRLPTTSLGMMLNDTLGDCTCAAVYHRRQLVTALTNPPMDTEPDSIVETLYEVFGYVPGQPATDQGAGEQDVLTYWQRTGIPLASGQTNKLTAYVEIDPANSVDIDWAINDCLGLYIGFNVPAYLTALEAPGSVWDVPAGGGDPGGDAIIGGHAVYVTGHLTNGNRPLISWGSPAYQMTPAFWLQYVDETYALVDADLLAATSDQTVLGMTLAQLQSAIAAL